MALRRSALASTLLALMPLTQAWNIELPPCVEPFKPFVYSGCFQDGHPNALIFRSTLDQKDMTVEKCIAECKGNGFRYAGLEYYGICFCGATVNGAQLDESKCSFPCNGNKTEKCGGDNTLSIWQDPTFPKGPDDTTVDDYKSLGCYTDDSTKGRTLSWPIDLDASTFTTKKCLAACENEGFPFAGVEFGRECWCGVVLANDTAKVDDSQCNSPCQGDPSATCGGPGRLNLWVAKDLESLEPCGHQPGTSTTSRPITITTTTKSADTTTTKPVDTTTTSKVTTTTSKPQTTTTKPDTTTEKSATTSKSDTTTTKPNTTTKQSTTTSSCDEETTSKPSTTTLKPTTTTKPDTTTKPNTTTLKPTTTSKPDTTTTKPTTTSKPDTTTTKPTTTSKPDTTTKPNTTTEKPTTTSKPDTATTKPTTTSKPNTTTKQSTTTPKPDTTTKPSTTTEKPTTTKPQTTTTKPNTTTKQSTTDKPHTTTKPTTTTKDTPHTTTNLCTATVTLPPKCEWQCGQWCAPPLPPWGDKNGCNIAQKTCHNQVSSCFKHAGWPGSVECFKFKAWCKFIDAYCLSSCPSDKCGKWDCWNKHHGGGGKPPGNSPTTTTTVYPCPTTSKPVPTTTKPATSCAPEPTNICTQPTNNKYGYGPGKPVGGIPLPVVGCNDCEDEFDEKPFKFYTEAETRDCPGFPWTKWPNVCAQACKEQYDECVATYSKGCETLGWKDDFHKRAVEFETELARREISSRTFPLIDSLLGKKVCALSSVAGILTGLWAGADSDGVQCWGWGGNKPNLALERCKAQYQDCLSVNQWVNPKDKCKHWPGC